MSICIKEFNNFLHPLLLWWVLKKTSFGKITHWPSHYKVSYFYNSNSSIQWKIKNIINNFILCIYRIVFFTSFDSYAAIKRRSENWCVVYQLSVTPFSTCFWSLFSLFSVQLMHLWFCGIIILSSLVFHIMG